MMTRIEYLDELELDRQQPETILVTYRKEICYLSTIKSVVEKAGLSFEFLLWEEVVPGHTIRVTYIIGFDWPSTATGSISYQVEECSCEAGKAVGKVLIDKTIL